MARIATTRANKSKESAAREPSLSGTFPFSSRLLSLVLRLCSKGWGVLDPGPFCDWSTS